MADYPVAIYHFKVTIDGAEIAFSEVSGLSQEAQHLEYRHGNAKDKVTEKRIGMIKTAEISMKKGITKGGAKILNIFKKVYNGVDYGSQGKTIPLSIQLLDEKGGVVCTWKVPKAVPTKMEAPSLKSDGNTIAIEGISFQHEGIELSF